MAEPVLEVPANKTSNIVKKRLIICCDGTWFSADKGTINMPSNVARISRLIASEGVKVVRNDKGEDINISIPQIVYYQSGVGTGSLTFVDKRIQGGLGSGLDENVCTAYNFICNNYAENDEIYLFGFSRGAYTARALSGLIIGAGILPPGAMALFPEMYQEYKKRQSKGEFRKSHFWEKNKEALEYTYHDVKLKFVGVWDTVGALGIPESAISGITGWNSGYQFYDTELHKNIGKAAHALALDEYRGPFTPTLWYHKQEDSHGWSSNLIQCWFPGFHGHVGGGTVTGKDENLDETSVDDLALAWMVDQVGTRLTWDEKEINRFVAAYESGKYGWAEGNLEDSASVAYALPMMGGWVVRTPGQYNHEKAKKEKKNPGSDRPEYWGTNEYIHPSVRYRMGFMDTRKPKDVGYDKGVFRNTPKKEYKPWALSKFSKPARQTDGDYYWYWKKEDREKGEVLIREYQIPPMWSEGYQCLGLERKLVPPELLKELDEGNNYGETGPIAPK
ncbi:hypothetical protein ABW20_dc0102429 [Dactylellina cionopaga]|nr:hypothetical protein ABW20_dc0102429 [Dactylellina cionopaga]